MSNRLVRILAVLATCSLIAVSVTANRAAHPAQAAPATTLMYSAGGHLWLRPVDGGAARLIRAPWPMGMRSDSPQGAQWSPDGRRIALDNGKSRLAVINLTNGHVTFLASRGCANCGSPNYSWSPQGRYLAFLRPTGNGDFSNLSIWDSSSGTTRSLLGGVSSFSSSLDWSHDSTRLAVNTGVFDVVHSIFPSTTVVDLSGHSHRVGKGLESGWSPDDKLIAIVRPNQCGANTCDDNELVRPSAGGPATTLVRHLDSNFEGVGWAPQPIGYAFDRWLLDSSGHITRKLAAPNERIDSWQPSGAHVALQTYYPYYSTPDTLFISTPQGTRVKLYTDGPNDGCGACSKDVYSVAWSHNGQLVAFATPEYPTPKTLKTVYPIFFVAGINGGSRTRIPIPGSDYVNILGFANNDTALVIRSGKQIYRYAIPTHRVTVIATGVISASALPALYPK